MSIYQFDTLAYAREIEKSGFTREQAEGFAMAQKKMLQEAITTSELATKDDLKVEIIALKSELTTEIQKVRTELKAEIQDVRTELKAEIQDVRTELKVEIQDVRTELKAEIQELRDELKTEIAQVRAEAKKDIQDVRNEIQNLDIKISDVKHDMLKWLIGFFMGQAALIITAVGVMFTYFQR